MCLEIVAQIRYQVVDYLTQLGENTRSDEFNSFWVNCSQLLTSSYCSPTNYAQFKDFSTNPLTRDKLEKFLSDKAILFLIQEFFIDRLVNKHFNKYSNLSEFRICKDYVGKNLAKKLVDDEFFIKNGHDTFCNNVELRNQLTTYLEKQVSLYIEEQLNLLQAKGRYEDIVLRLHSECLDFQEFLYKRIRKMSLPSSYKLSFATNCTLFQNGNGAVPVQINLIKHKNNHKPDKKKDIDILQKVKAEINKYHTVQALRNQVRLDDQKNAHDKFVAFDTLFRDSTSQENLKTYFDSWTWRFLKNIGHILTAGLVSRFITKGTWRFWKTTEELFIERMTIQSQKNADYQRKMHAETEVTSAPESISSISYA